MKTHRDYQSFKNVKIRPASIKIQGRTLKFILDMRQAKAGLFEIGAGGTPRFVASENTKIASRIPASRKFRGPKAARQLSAFHAYARTLVRKDATCFIQGTVSGHLRKGRNLRMSFGCLS